MLPHQCLIEYLINLIVRAPLVTHDMVGDRLNKLIVDIIPCTLVLQVGVSIGRDTFGVVKLHVDLVRTEHVYCY